MLLKTNFFLNKIYFIKYNKLFYKNLINYLNHTACVYQKINGESESMVLFVAEIHKIFHLKIYVYYQNKEKIIERYTNGIM